jgi:hypothetical protein
VARRIVTYAVVTYVQPVWSYNFLCFVNISPLLFFRNSDTLGTGRDDFINLSKVLIFVI